MPTVRLLVRASDPLSFAGVVAHIRRHPDIELLTDARAQDADVCLVVAPVMNAVVMAEMRGLSEQATNARFVLILDRLGDADLLSAVEMRLAAVVWRAEATAERVRRTVVAVSRGGVEIPGSVQAKLVSEVQALQRSVLAPRHLTACGLEEREVEVLRFIAAGLDMSEIAGKMAYSERTIKGILYTLMARLNLRNRAHAVAYAMRAGVL